MSLLSIIIYLLFGLPVAALVLYFVYIFLLNFLIVPNNVRRFEKRIIKRLNKGHYKWKRDEGDLCILKNGVCIRIKFHRLYRPAIRVFFEYSSSDPQLVNKSRLIEPTDMSVDIVDAIAIVLWGDNQVRLFYRADIRSASEFMQELEYAYYRYLETLQPIL